MPRLNARKQLKEVQPEDWQKEKDPCLALATLLDESTAVRAHRNIASEPIPLGRTFTEPPA